MSEIIESEAASLARPHWAAVAPRSAIEAEVDLGANSWVLADSVCPGDLAQMQEGAPFIVDDWVGCPGGFIVFDVNGGSHFCPTEFPYVFMLEADFMRCHFPSSAIFR